MVAFTWPYFLGSLARVLSSLSWLSLDMSQQESSAYLFHTMTGRFHVKLEKKYKIIACDKKSTFIRFGPLPGFKTQTNLSSTYSPKVLTPDQKGEAGLCVMWLKCIVLSFCGYTWLWAYTTTQELLLFIVFYFIKLIATKSIKTLSPHLK